MLSGNSCIIKVNGECVEVECGGEKKVFTKNGDRRISLGDRWGVLVYPKFAGNGRKFTDEELGESLTYG